MSLPPNFGRAVDLSSLTKPAQATNAIASKYEITTENFAAKAVELSRTKPVILLVWSPRSPESMTTLETLSKLAEQANETWELGSIDADTQPKVAQALQTKNVPYAVALINEQPVPLMGEMAAWSIMERLRKPSAEVPSLVLPTTLVVRNSTKRLEA